MLADGQDRLKEEVLVEDVPNEDIVQKYNNHPGGGGVELAPGAKEMLANLEATRSEEDPGARRLEASPEATRSEAAKFT